MIAHAANVAMGQSQTCRRTPGLLVVGKRTMLSHSERRGARDLELDSSYAA